MPDITITWDPVNNRGDWSVAAGDLATGGDLYNAVLISLFTDRVLPAAAAPPDGTTDHRGWAGDTYAEMPIGSRLWTLKRYAIASVSGLLQDAQDICNEALAWLVVDGVADSVSVQTYYLGQGQLGIAVAIVQPGGGTVVFKFSWAWNGVTS